MGQIAEKLIFGILAHVDAGKTTLAESILYQTGMIRHAGRVDHGDAFLDTDAMEKERGITIFSKHAELQFGEMKITLLDTPGHVDFSAEMERALQVMDYAILVISGADGVQGHSETLWRLLKRYQIPVFLFINKMDQPGTDQDKLMAELKKKLDSSCVNFSVEQNEEFFENLAENDEHLMEKYFEDGMLEQSDIADLVAERKVFPCYFGSALKIFGVDELLKGIESYAKKKSYPDKFGARVYKITRDDQGSRLTWMKITGGSLKVKQLLNGSKKDAYQDEDADWVEKADQIRIYSGKNFQSEKEVFAGTLCAVTGLTNTYSGEGLGTETEAGIPLLEPVLTYQIKFPPEIDVFQMYLKLKQLEEEEPELHLIWKEQSREIHAQVMGDVQIEILQKQIYQRFQVVPLFGTGSIVYKETIRNTVEGVGHYEPLRHYAEVHLLLEPGEPGSGLSFRSLCSEDVLDKNWQRLIMTHLEEKMHVGVLTGSELTDVQISILTGRAHIKHTEGGDFRQATYRAVRQGLRKAESVLLEPMYDFRLEVPSENIGRAMNDIQRMNGEFSSPELEGEFAILEGKAPVVCMNGYQKEVISYTKGRGKLSCTHGGYAPCHNADEVIEALAYDPEADLNNPTSSVFCAHGAGFLVEWYDVESYMQVESPFKQKVVTEETVIYQARRAAESSREEFIDDDELKAIFQRTFHANKKEEERRRYSSKKVREYTPQRTTRRSDKKVDEKEYLLVDGYNVIFAWDHLKELAEKNIESARDSLMDILSDYQGYRHMTLILVFDAYKVQGGQGEVFQYHNIHVVYTKEAETADQYIEKTVHEIGKNHKVMVATSDALEQVIILGQGATRISSQGLWKEIEDAKKEMQKEFLAKQNIEKNYLFDGLSEEMHEWVKDVRLGKKDLDEK